MLDYLLRLSPWLFVCFLVGAATGVLSHRTPPRRLSRWLIWLCLAFWAGLVAAGLGALRGRTGAMLESALAFTASFLIGAASAAFAAEHSWRRHEGWAVGLLPVALLWLVSIFVALPEFEGELQRQAVALAAKAGEDSSGLTAEGRDVSAPASIWNNAALVQKLHDMRGLRKLLGPTDATESASARREDDSAPPRPDIALAPERAATDPAGVLAALPAGNLGLTDCAAALTATTSLDPITFREASALIRREAALALDKAALFIRRCPDVAIEVIGRADAIGAEGDNSELSLRRAEAAARYLRREGIGGRRLIVIGYGVADPIAPNSDEAGRAQNRSISFAVKPTM